MPWRLDANGLRQVPESEAPDKQEFCLICPSCGARRSYFTSCSGEWAWFCIGCGLSEAPLMEWLVHTWGASRVREWRLSESFGKDFQI